MLIRASLHLTSKTFHLTLHNVAPINVVPCDHALFELERHEIDDCHHVMSLPRRPQPAPADDYDKRVQQSCKIHLPGALITKLHCV